VGDDKQPLLEIVGDIENLYGEMKSRLARPLSLVKLAGAWNDGLAIRAAREGKQPLRNLLLLASPRCIFSDVKASRDDLLAELLALLKRLDGAVSRPRDLDGAARRVVRKIIGQARGDELEEDGEKFRARLPATADEFVKILLDEVPHVEAGEGADTRPIVRLEFTGEPVGKKYRVIVNGTPVLLSKTHFEVIKLLYFKQQRGDQETPLVAQGGLVPPGKAKGVQTRMSDFRRLELPKDAKAVFGSLPHPLIDPDADQFNPKLNVIVNPRG
jgi:hypothetical protein